MSIGQRSTKRLMKNYRLSRRVEILEAAVTATSMDMDNGADERFTECIAKGLQLIGFPPEGNESLFEACCRAIGIRSSELDRLLRLDRDESSYDSWPKEDVANLTAFAYIVHLGRESFQPQLPAVDPSSSGII